MSYWRTIRIEMPSKASRAAKSTPRGITMSGWRPALRPIQDDVRSGWRDAAARTQDLIQNVGWIAGALQQVVANTVGNGLRLNAQPDFEALGISEIEASALARQIERRWRSWAARPYECDIEGRRNFGQLQAAALMNYFAFGEHLAERAQLEMVVGVEDGQRTLHLGGRRRVQRGRGAGEQSGDGLAARQTVAQAAEVAGTAPAQRQARQGPRHVPQSLQFLAQLLAQGSALDEPTDGVQPDLDSGGVQQGASQPGGQQPGAGRGDGAVDGAQQGALAGARQALFDLQAGPRGRIDGHDIGLTKPAIAVAKTLHNHRVCLSRLQ